MKKNTLLLAIFTLSLFLVSCGKGNDKETLIYALFKEPKDLDPAMMTDVPSKGIIDNICEGLIGYEGETETKIVPRLASRWDVSSDAKTYTFHLRDGVKFHDGTDVDADAVLFSLQRQHDKTNAYYKANYSYWIGTGMSENVVSISKTDNKTVVIQLNHPDGTFLAKMALPMADVVSPSAYRQLNDDFDKNPVCTGPFIFKKWNKAQSILLVRNNDYWDKVHLPKMQKIIFKIIIDSSARFLALKKGEVDVIEELNPQDIRSLQEDSNLQLVMKPTSSQRFLWFNTEHKPFDDVKVRQALAHLVDKQRIINNVLLGYGRVAVNPIPTTMWGYNHDVVDYDYNIEKAKQLLVEAGYPNGFDMELYYNKENADRKSIAEILQASFAGAGVRVNIRNSEWGTFVNDVKYRKYTGAALLGWASSYLDPNDFLTMNFSKKAAIKPGINIGGWLNDKFDQYIEEAAQLNDIPKRIELYKKAQVVFHEEIPAVILYESDALFGMRKNVKNFVYLPLMTPILKYISKE